MSQSLFDRPDKPSPGWYELWCQWISLPIVRVVWVLLAGAVMYFGYEQIWLDPADQPVDTVAQRVVQGILLVGAGGLALVMLLLWRPRQRG